jgi:hypothetical protein
MYSKTSAMSSNGRDVRRELALSISVDASLASFFRCRFVVLTIAMVRAVDAAERESDNLEFDD